MWLEIEFVHIGSEIIDILRESDVVRAIERKPVVREGGQLLTGHKFCILVGAIMECTADVILSLRTGN